MPPASQPWFCQLRSLLASQAPTTLVITVFTSTAFAQAPVVTPGAAAGSITMGSIAQRAAANDPSLVTLLRDAIAHADPGVRLVAARIAANRRLTALRGDIEGVLAAETEPRVAAEYVRALLLAGTPDSVAAVEHYVGRAEPAAVVEYAGWLGRRDPARFVERIPFLLGRLGAEHAAVFANLTMVVARQYPERRGDFLRGWLRHAPASAWRELLNVLPAPADDDKADLAVLAEAQASVDPAVREATMWRVIRWLVMHEGRGRPAAVAAIDLPPPAMDPPLSWEQFLREVVGRRVRNDRRLDRASSLASLNLSDADGGEALLGFDQVSGSEKRAIRAALERAEVLPAVRSLASIGPDAQGHFPSVRTMPTAWRGLLTSILQAAECTPPTESRFAEVGIVFDADGRPISSAFADRDVPAACGGALRALAAIATPDPRVPITTATQWLVMPFSREFVTCSDSWPDAAAVQAPRRHMTAPKARRRVTPTYSQEGLDDKVSGVVALEAIVTSAGCVSQVAMTRSVLRSLDVIAVRATSGWHFDPAKVDGTARHTIITMTMEFRVHDGPGPGMPPLPGTGGR